MHFHYCRLCPSLSSNGERFSHVPKEQVEFGKDSSQWRVLAAGRRQMPFDTQTAFLGGNMHVGLWDSLFESRKLAVFNAGQVGKIRRIFTEIGLESATLRGAGEMLGLKRWQLRSTPRF